MKDGPWGVESPLLRSSVKSFGRVTVCVCPRLLPKGGGASGYARGFQHPASHRVMPLSTGGYRLNADEMTCPDCAETIKAAAKVCKHCGYRFLETSLAPQPEASSAPIVASMPDDAPPVSAEPDWWDRTFDDGRAAKCGCLIIPLILILGLLGGLTFWPKTASAPAIHESVRAKETQESRALDVASGAKMSLEAKVKDRASVRYRDLFVSNSGDPLWALCGSVNSKNGFGAYTGFKPFVAFAEAAAPTVIQGESTGLGADMDRELYGAAYKQFCGNVVARF